MTSIYENDDVKNEKLKILRERQKKINKDRYNNDPEYREKQKQYNRDRRKKVTEALQLLKKIQQV